MSENTETIQVQGQQTFEGMPEPEQTVELLDLVTEDQYSAYGIWKLVNVIAEKTEVELSDTMKNRPQIMYNYARNGLVVAGESIKKGTYVSRKYSKNEVVAFLTRYFSKK
jgi:hypothetical protein